MRGVTYSKSIICLQIKCNYLFEAVTVFSFAQVVLIDIRAFTSIGRITKSPAKKKDFEWFELQGKIIAKLTKLNFFDSQGTCIV